MNDQQTWQCVCGKSAVERTGTRTGTCPACNARSWPCQQCGETVLSAGFSSPCGNCNAQYNGSGQRLRDDWQGNRSVYDDDISDLDGYEQQHAGDY